jgi:hypothetical protein
MMNRIVLLVLLAAVEALASGCKRKSTCGYTKLPPAFAAFKGAIGDGKICMPHRSSETLQVVYKSRSSAGLAAHWKHYIETKLRFVVVNPWGRRGKY